MVNYIVSKIDLFIILNELSVHKGRNEKKDEKRKDS